MTKQEFIACIAARANLSDIQAAAVFDIYVKERIVKCNPYQGFSVTHGAFLDYDVLRRAARGGAA